MSRPTEELVRRRAEEGSRLALAMLLERRRVDAKTSGLFKRLVAAGSEAAVAALADRPTAFRGAWELLVGQAELGSEPALRAITKYGVDPDHWELVERRAAEGSAVAIRLSAWREWAVATGGPDVDLGLEGPLPR